MAKIDLEKLICSLAERNIFLQDALKEQGLEYKDGEIVEIQKPKFHEGDWVVFNYLPTEMPISKIIKIENGIVELRDPKGMIVQTEEPLLYLNYHLWTINDSEDGDVLACGDKVTDCPFIFHNLTEELNPRSYCGVNTLRHFQDNDENGGSWCELDEVRPATKEQRDLLFQKMHEAGYEWDADKKELKKIYKPLYEAGNIIGYKSHYYYIKKVVKNEEKGFHYNLIAIDGGEVISIGPAGEKDIILISNNRFDYAHANIQQKDYSPKASTANRQIYNRAILKILSDYVEKYPDTRFVEMLCNLGFHLDYMEESQITYLDLNKIINKSKDESKN